MNYSPRRYLVIGANSFLAKEIILRLYQNNFVVGVFHQHSSNLVQGVKNINIEEFELLKDDFDVVFYLSAHISKKGEEENKSLLMKVNVELPERISEKFKKAKIIYASSVSVYPENDKLINEKSELAANSEYGKSKIAGEKVIANHPQYSIIRISSMFGIGMKENTFLPRIVVSAIKNRTIKIYGNGSRLQNYIHIADVAEIFIRAANQHSNNTYLAVGERSYTNLEIASLIGKELENTDIELIGVDDSSSFVYDSAYSYSTLNFKPQQRIEEGIIELIKWQQKKF